MALPGSTQGMSQQPSWNVGFPRSPRGVQPEAHGPHAAQDGYGCRPTQNRKLLTTFPFCLSIFISVCVFNVGPKTTLLPVRPRDAKRLDTPARSFHPPRWLTYPLKGGGRSRVNSTCLSQRKGSMTCEGHSLRTKPKGSTLPAVDHSLLEC